MVYWVLLGPINVGKLTLFWQIQQIVLHFFNSSEHYEIEIECNNTQIGIDTQFETGIYLQNDYNILVKAPVKDRINRVIKRDKISKVDVLKRISSQWSDSKKMDLADFVIDNIDKLETEKIVKQLIIDLISRYEKN